MINSISFKGDFSTDPTRRLTDETINQPQAFVAATSSEKPNAASGVQGDSFGKEKKHKTGKVIAVVAFIAAAAATALAVLSGKGAGKLKGKLGEWASSIVTKNTDSAGKVAKHAEIINTILTKANSVGEKISEFAVKYFNKAKNILHRSADEVQQTAQETGTKGTEAAQEVAQEAATKGADVVQEVAQEAAAKGADVVQEVAQEAATKGADVVQEVAQEAAEHAQ